MGRKNSSGSIARHVEIAVLLSLTTAGIEILLTLSPLAAGGASGGRYAVDIGRTLVLYAAIGTV